MPGLLRGVARTAVVAGTATAVSNRVSRRQARRWGAQGEAQGMQYYYGDEPQAAQVQQMAPPPAYAAEPEPEVDRVAQLRDLGKLHTDGILTDEEFEAEKRKILNS
jgi:hypothetical protein